MTQKPLLISTGWKSTIIVIVIVIVIGFGSLEIEEGRRSTTEEASSDLLSALFGEFDVGGWGREAGGSVGGGGWWWLFVLALQGRRWWILCFLRHHSLQTLDENTNTHTRIGLYTAIHSQHCRFILVPSHRSATGPLRGWDIFTLCIPACIYKQKIKLNRNKSEIHIPYRVVLSYQ